MLEYFRRIFHWGADVPCIHLCAPIFPYSSHHVRARFIKRLRHLFIATLLGLAWFAPLQANNVPVPVGSIYYVQGLGPPVGPITGFSPEELAAQLVPVAQKIAESAVAQLNSTYPNCPSNNCAKLTGSATCSTNSVHQINCSVPGEYPIPYPSESFGSGWTWAVIPPPALKPTSNDGCSTYGNPCNALTGEKTQTDTDLSNPVEGLSVIRTYSSYSSLAPSGGGLFYENNQGFGIGWSTPWHKRLVIMADGTGAVAYRGQAVYVPFTPNGTGFTPHPTSNLQLIKNGTEFILRQVNGTQERYDATGRLLSETSANGRTTSYGYNPASRVATVTGPHGHKLTLTYTAEGYIDTLTNPAGRIIRYTYSNKNLIQVSYPDGTGRLYHYYGDNTAMPHHLTGISIVNANGITSRFATFSYEGGRQATATEHPITTNTLPQEKFQFSYAGVWTDITDPAGNKERLYITTQNNTKLLTQRTNLTDNKTLIQTYDPNNNLTCKQDETGRVTTSTYNATHQRLSQTEGRTGTCSAPVITPATRTTTYQYLSPTLDMPTVITTPSVAPGLVKRTIMSYTDPRFPTLPTSITQSGFTPSGLPVSRSVALGYNARGQVASINGPRSPSDPGMNGIDDVTTLTYYDCTTGNACGQIQRVTNPLGHTTTYNSYTPDGRVTQVTDPNGIVTTYAYDPRGRVSYLMQNGNGSLNYRTTTYTPDGQIKTIYTYPGDLEYTYTYDAAQNLRRISDSLGNYVDYQYDIKGNRTRTLTMNPDDTQAQGLKVAYDLRNHVQSLTHGGKITTLINDAVGNLTKEIDPNHTAVASTVGTVHTYDALNRLFQTTDVLAGLTQYTYNINDQIQQVKSPNNAVTTTVYDDLGNLLQEISPDRGTTISTYDAAGNIKTQLDARNVLVTYTYDALNRPSIIDYPGATQDITYVYDTALGCTFGLGRLCRTSTSSLTTTYAYNGFGHRTSHIQTLQGITTTTHTQRNPWGWIMGHTYPGGRLVKYTRDPRGRLTSIKATVNGALTPLISSRVYRGDDQLAHQVLGNGISDTRLYTGAGRLNYQFIGTDTRVYGYDHNGNLTTKQTLPEVATYTYDPLDRLTLDTDPTPVSFIYDPNGNRKTGAGITYAYTPNSNTLATVNGQAITISPNGNVRNDPARGLQYNYNNANELGTVFQNGVFLASYAYDPEHRRISKVSPDGMTLYHYDQEGHLLQETDSTGTLIKAYVWADDMPIAQITKTQTGSEQLLYLHTDHQHTPRLATGPAGVVRWRWEGNAFGDTAPNEDPSSTGVKMGVNLRYAGQYYDQETGLHYNWNRYYDPRLGRYISSDPIGLAGGLNTYAYVLNNPLRYVDPLGLAAQACDSPPSDDSPPSECTKIGEQSSKWPGVPAGYKRCTYSCKTSSGQHTIPRYVPESQECPDKLYNQWVPGTANPPTSSGPAPSPPTNITPPPWWVIIPIIPIIPIIFN